MNEYTSVTEYTKEELRDFLKTRKQYMINIIKECVAAVESTDNAIMSLMDSEKEEDTILEELYHILTEYNKNLYTMNSAKKHIDTLRCNVWLMAETEDNENE